MGSRIRAELEIRIAALTFGKPALVRPEVRREKLVELGATLHGLSTAS
jgi:hypothetical protein